MSSFRIDRQYVSFVTTEARPVCAAGQISDIKALDTAAAGTDGQTEKAERHYAEILEEARKEADEKARLILEQAGAEAEAIVGTARQLADEIVGKAQSSAENIREDASRTGYDQGQKSAQVQANARKSRQAQELGKIVDKLKGEYSDLVDGMRRDVILLSRYRH